MTSSTTTSRRACVLALLVGALCVSVGVCGDTPPVQPPAGDSESSGSNAPPKHTTPKEKQLQRELSAARLGAALIIDGCKALMFADPKVSDMIEKRARGFLKSIVDVLDKVKSHTLITWIPSVHKFILTLDRFLYPMSMLVKHWDVVFPEAQKKYNLPETLTEAEIKEYQNPVLFQSNFRAFLKIYSELFKKYSPPAVNEFMQKFVIACAIYMNDHLDPHIFYGGLYHGAKENDDVKLFKAVLHYLQTVRLYIDELLKPYKTKNKQAHKPLKPTQNTPQKPKKPKAEAPVPNVSHKNLDFVQKYFQKKPTTDHSVLIIVCIVGTSVVLVIASIAAIFVFGCRKDGRRGFWALFKSNGSTDRELEALHTEDVVERSQAPRLRIGVQEA